MYVYQAYGYQILYAYKEGIIINNFLNDDTLRRAKNKIDTMLSEKQKAELMEKIKGMDKATLVSMLKNIDPNKVGDESLRNFIKEAKKGI